MRQAAYTLPPSNGYAGMNRLKQNNMIFKYNACAANISKNLCEWNKESGYAL